MSRVKISEYKAKELIYKALHSDYNALPLTDENYLEQVSKLSTDAKYVVKVDQGIKKRNKLGLIELNVPREEILSAVSKFKQMGYSRFLVEEFVQHDPKSERYLSLERVREGIRVLYSQNGGVNIEEQKESLKSVIFNTKNVVEISSDLGITIDTIDRLIAAFEKLFISFIEINPFIVLGTKTMFLDMAVEVDSAAEFFVSGSWSATDVIDNNSAKSPEEIEMKKLADGSSASFKFVMLNPIGSNFTIFSGGGASIVLADEFHNLGRGKELANYAEYSGGPTEDETYIFAKNIISLLLKSPANNKKLFIAGGVANFTDIRATFKGVIKALDEYKDQLTKQKIKVYVRRGGPFQEEGLSMMKNFLEDSQLLGDVMGPDRVLTEIITKN